MIRSDAPEFFECAVLLNSFTYSNSLIPAHAVCCGKRINNLQTHTRIKFANLTLECKIRGFSKIGCGDRELPPDVSGL